ncbi:MAG: hypothetical protein O2913_03900 [Chloroflexi bacterium]|nr:hypothetical protein [Chloroflexota bacterium]
MAKKRYPLPKRFNAALSDEAYEKLRGLNADYGLGNNYILTVLLENLDAIADDGALAKAFEESIAEHGAPTPGGMRQSDSTE